jgi:hypothetical protein
MSLKKCVRLAGTHEMALDISKCLSVMADAMLNPRGWHPISGGTGSQESLDHVDFLAGPPPAGP